MKFLMLTLISLFFSCSKSDPLATPGPISPTPGQSDQLKEQSFSIDGEYGTKWSKKWTQVIFDSLEDQNSSLLTNKVKLSDLRKVRCSNFNDFSKRDKKRFWALFFSSISHFESSFNPSERYWESSLGKYSEGLLQLSIDDSNYYDFCDLDRETILKPSYNLSCGVSVMGKQISGSRRRVSGELFPTSMFYWSVLTKKKLKSKVIRFFNKRVKGIIPNCI